MRSERRFASAALGLTAALLALVSCRGIYLPEPEPEPPAVPQTLEIAVTAPDGVEFASLRIIHDNRAWQRTDESLVRTGSEYLDGADRVVFTDLVEGPTLLEYSWNSTDGQSHSSVWGVVRLPRPVVEMDFRQTNTVIHGAVRVEGEPLDLQQFDLHLYGRIADLRDGAYAYFDTSADSLAVVLVPGAWSLRGHWDFPPSSPLRSVVGELADSLVVPVELDLDLDFEWLWIEPHLGGLSLRNVDMRWTQSFVESPRFSSLQCEYRTETTAGDVVPVLHAGRVFQLSVFPTSAGAPFPWRRIWLEAAAGDTLRVDLAENRVRIRLRRATEPVAFLGLQIDAQRLDTGSVTVATDDQGEVDVWLPHGVYRVGLSRPGLGLVGDDLFDLQSDTLLVLEVEGL